MPLRALLSAGSMSVVVSCCVESRRKSTYADQRSRVFGERGTLQNMEHGMGVRICRVSVIYPPVGPTFLIILRFRKAAGVLGLVLNPGISPDVA